MEYAKDEIFNIKYNNTLNTIEIGQTKKRKKILEVIKKHKLIMVFIITFIIFSIINTIMISNFFKILQNI